jgi:hypothetical protein
MNFMNVLDGIPLQEVFIILWTCVALIFLIFSLFAHIRKLSIKIFGVSVIFILSLLANHWETYLLAIALIGPFVISDLRFIENIMAIIRGSAEPVIKDRKTYFERKENVHKKIVQEVLIEHVDAFLKEEDAILNNIGIRYKKIIEKHVRIRKGGLALEADGLIQGTQDLLFKVKNYEKIDYAEVYYLQRMYKKIMNKNCVVVLVVISKEDVQESILAKAREYDVDMKRFKVEVASESS